MTRRFKNRFAGFQSSSFASSKSPRAFLKSSIYLTIAKVAKQLRLRDVRLNRDAECEEHKRPEELKVDQLMGKQKQREAKPPKTCW